MSKTHHVRLRRFPLWLSTCFLFLFVFLLATPVQASASTAKIHLITLPGNSEAVLLESRDEGGNPIFGLVDTGEDNDYPDGRDSRYPLRDGVVIGNGNEDQVFSYLNTMGVTSSNLRFIVCTHPHSDHIGLADTLIRQYSPDYVYLMEYSDSYISNSNRLWDNLYVYDQTLAACQETTGVTLIQDPAERSSFGFGAFTIQVVNGSQDYMSNPKSDVNQFSLGVVATANGHTAFLSSDIDNSDGDENRLVSQYGLYSIDLLISNHHGYYVANQDSYLMNVAPKYYLQDGTFATMLSSVTSTLSSIGSHLYSAGSYYGRESALIVDFTGSEAVCNADDTYIINSSGKKYAYYNGLPYTGVFTLDGNEYAGDEEGVLRTSTSWVNPEDGLQYMFDANGVVTRKTTELGWVKEDGKWYYRDADGNNETGWITYSNNWYYLKEDGSMATGWLKLDDTWYYLASWGGRMTGWQKIGGAWYYLDPKNNDGMIANTWFRAPDGYFYYAQSWGGTYCNTTKTINGVQYTFNSSCRVTNLAWCEMDGNTYLISGGKTYVGWANMKKGYYYLNSDGTLKKDELFLYKGCYYYVDKTGLMAHESWASVKGNWYYFKSWGGAYANSWLLYKNCWYWFNNDGTMMKGWAEINGKTYYFYSWGGMATGKLIIDDEECEFASSGALISKTPIVKEEEPSEEENEPSDSNTDSTGSDSTDNNNGSSESNSSNNNSSNTENTSAATTDQAASSAASSGSGETINIQSDSDEALNTESVTE